MSIETDYILAHLPDFLNRDVLQEFFTLPVRTPGTFVDGGKVKVEFPIPLFEGKLVEVNGHLWRVNSFEKEEEGVYLCDCTDTGIKPTVDKPLCDCVDPCILNKGVIANYNGPDGLKTTIGRVIVNYLLLAEPFGDIVPYINERLDDKLGDIVTNLLLQEKVTADQHRHYTRNLNFIGNSPEFVSPNLTVKALTTSPDVLKKRKELMEKYGDKIKQGDAMAMAAVEKGLIEMDKEYLKDDLSMRYLAIDEKKMFNNVRKKLLLTHGSVNKFGDKSNFDFIPTSLEEGYQQKTLSETFNEIRDGSYSRSTETAKGGAESKVLLRVFQNTRITEKNCGSTQYLSVKVKPYNSKEYMYRYYNTGGNKLELVTDKNYKSLEGKTVQFRSPLYCHAKTGFCDVCMGQLFSTIGQKALASSANEIGSTILSLSMKAMHTSGVSVVALGDLDDYIVGN